MNARIAPFTPGLPRPTRLISTLLILGLLLTRLLIGLPLLMR